ncbi:MAG TPA: FprA family A-type flavoprotein [Armatimonadota bacterium]|nr:FprA family A-type flavoprotein [Armatimonadota bacterium]
MASPYQAIRVSDHVYWVGAIDWAVRDFHGYLTQRGTTYNAFLVMGDRIALIDTVRSAFFDEMMARIASVVDPSRIDVIVSNHAELDHSGGLRQAIAALNPTDVHASDQGVKALIEHFGPIDNLTPVSEAQPLDLGNMGLSFIETRMLHWPDSMFSYLAEDQVLFCQDAFGMHLATSERFDDELPLDLLNYEAARYYANILMPLSTMVTKLLERYGKLGLAVKYLATDHGPIWRSRLDHIMGLYGQWAAQAPSRKAVVAYETMWGSTSRMAHAVAEGLIAQGVSTKVMKLGACHRSDIATEVLDAGALLLGTPTLNSTMLPQVADVLCYLRGLQPKNLVGAVFGSHGWNGKGVDHARESLAAMGVELVGDAVRSKYVPDATTLDQCRALGESVAHRLGQICPA